MSGQSYRILQGLPSALDYPTTGTSGDCDVLRRSKLGETCLDVAHKGYPLLPKSAQNSGEIVCQIWALE